MAGSVFWACIAVVVEAPISIASAKSGDTAATATSCIRSTSAFLAIECDQACRCIVYRDGAWLACHCIPPVVWALKCALRHPALHARGLHTPPSLGSSCCYAWLLPQLHCGHKMSKRQKAAPRTQRPAGRLAPENRQRLFAVMHASLSAEHLDHSFHEF